MSDNSKTVPQTTQPLLFADLPEIATPIPIGSREWADREMLKAVEGVRFNPERLAAYEAKCPDGRAFLDHVIWQLGGRSQ